MAILPGTTNKVNTTFADIITTPKYTKAFLEQTPEKSEHQVINAKKYMGTTVTKELMQVIKHSKKRTKDPLQMSNMMNLCHLSKLMQH